MVPGDKSISHRALIISAISIGVSEIDGLLESEDVLHTLKALKSLGVKIVKKKKNIWFMGMVEFLRRIQINFTSEIQELGQD